MKHKILHWIFERLFRLLRFNPCADCIYNMDEDESENLYNWSDGTPVETTTSNNTSYVQYVKVEKGDK